MNFIKPSILIICSTFVVGACAMEEETETQSASILEVNEDTAPDWIVDRSDADSRVIYTGAMTEYDAPVGSTSDDNAEVEPPVTPDTSAEDDTPTDTVSPVVKPVIAASEGIISYEEIAPANQKRKYDCDTTVSMIEHANYQAVKAVDMKTCMKRCDESRKWCVGFFYLNDANKCGLVAELAADNTVSWVDSGQGSAVCFALSK